VAGKSFGDCKCGHPKSEHKPGVGVPHAEAWKPSEAAHAAVAAAAAAAADAAEEHAGKQACEHYQVNMQAAEFGLCTCGFPKAAHGKTGKPRGSDLKKPAPPAAPPAPAVEYEPGACEHYQVDTTATEFGTCVCGWKKSEHGKPRRKKGEAPPPEAPAAALHEDRNAAPCAHYEVDVLSTKFGNCKCGWSKEDHRAAGTFVEPELREFAGGHGGDPKRPTIAPKKVQGKQDKPCYHYQVDVNAKTFGDCLCGHAKKAHREFGGHAGEEPAGAAPPPPPPAEVIVRDGTHPCAKFELDLKNQGGYGACLCGFSRKDHEDFHSDPAEWSKIKQALTPPKEFT